MAFLGSTGSYAAPFYVATFLDAGFNAGTRAISDSETVFIGTTFLDAGFNAGTRATWGTESLFTGTTAGTQFTLPPATGTFEVAFTSSLIAPSAVHIIVLNMSNDTSNLVAFAEKSETEGSPAPPCLKLGGYGTHHFRWAVSSGTRSISVKTKQAANLSPRPALVVRANTDIGVLADATAVAGSSTDWITVGPVTVVTSGTGGLWVELQNRQSGWAACYFDAIAVT